MKRAPLAASVLGTLASVFVVLFLAAALHAEQPDPARLARALALNAEAVARFDRGEPDEALALLRQALVLAPGEPVLRANAARCLIELGDAHLAARRFEDAVRDYHEAGGLTPDDPLPRLRQAHALLGAGRERDAVALLERLIARPDDLPQAERLLGEALYRLGENARALERWERAQALDPDPALAERLERVRREEALERDLFTDLAAPHFTIKYDGAQDQALGRLVGQILEEAYREVGLLLGRHPPREVAVVIYPGRTFQAATGAHAWVGGLYDGKIRVPAGGLTQADPREVRRVLTHEYAHALLSAVGGPSVPAWLHEGFAQVAEGRTHADARANLSRARAPALAELTGSFARVRERERVQLLYAAACDLVHTLLTQGGFPALADLVDRLGQNEPLDAALTRVYGRDLAELHAAWRESLPPR